MHLERSREIGVHFVSLYLKISLDPPCNIWLSSLHLPPFPLDRILETSCTHTAWVLAVRRSFSCHSIASLEGSDRGTLHTSC